MHALASPSHADTAVMPPMPSATPTPSLLLPAFQLRATSLSLFHRFLLVRLRLNTALVNLSTRLASSSLRSLRSVPTLAPTLASQLRAIRCFHLDVWRIESYPAHCTSLAHHQERSLRSQRWRRAMMKRYVHLSSLDPRFLTFGMLWLIYFEFTRTNVL